MFSIRHIFNVTLNSDRQIRRALNAQNLRNKTKKKKEKRKRIENKCAEGIKLIPKVSRKPFIHGGTVFITRRYRKIRRVAAATRCVSIGERAVETGRNDAGKRLVWECWQRRNPTVMHIRRNKARGTATMREIILSLICKYGSAFQIEALRDARGKTLSFPYISPRTDSPVSREIHLRSNLNFKPVKFCSSRLATVHGRVSLVDCAAARGVGGPRHPEWGKRPAGGVGEATGQRSGGCDRPEEWGSLSLRGNGPETRDPRGSSFHFTRRNTGKNNGDGKLTEGKNYADIVRRV